MSLVDYASSSDEEDDKSQATKISPPKRPRFEVPAEDPVRKPDKRSSTNIVPPSTIKQVTLSDNPSKLNLPDASALLNSPAMPSNLFNSSDHQSRVAAAMAESSARKRELNISSANYNRSSKVPKGMIPHTKNVPDTSGGRFLPPQLAGRSNIVTEDISKLFVKKHADPST